MRCYGIEFFDAADNMIAVYIYDTHQSGKYAEIIGAATPIIIKMAETTDAYTAIRYTTAAINVIQTNDERLELTDNLRYYVEVVNTDTEVCLWRGFIRADAYTQEYKSERSQFTYNAVDLLGAAQSIRLTDGAVTMRQAMQIICSKVPWDDVETTNGNIYVGNSMPTYNYNPVHDTFDRTSRPEHWRSFDDQTGETTLAPTFDLISEFCTLLGVTAYSNGVDWYIGSTDDTAFALCITQERCASGGMWTSSYQAINTDQLTNLMPAGQHQINILQPAQKVSMSYGGRGYSMGTMPNLSKENMSFGFALLTSATNTKGNPFNWFVIYEKGDEEKGVQIFRRHISDQSGYTADTVEPNRDNWLTCAAGAAFIRHDYWGTKEEKDTGSTYDGTKHNYNLTDTLVIWGKDETNGAIIATTGTRTADPDGALEEAQRLLLQRLTQPLVIMRSPSPVAFHGGGLCLSFRAIMDCVHFPLKYSGRSNFTYGLELWCSLRIGGKYWNGKNWMDNFVRFGVPFHCDDNNWTSGRENDNTKDIYQDYVCDGYSIPLTGYPLTGTAELIIYGVAKAEALEQQMYDGDHIVRFYDPRVNSSNITQIFDLSLTYCEPFSYEYKPGLDSPTRDKTKTREGGSGEASVSTALCSGHDVQDNDGIVEYTTEMSVHANQQTGTAEEIAFARLKRKAFATAQRITLSIDAEKLPLPVMNYEHKGMMYRVECGNELNVIDHEAKVSFIRYDNTI